MFTLCGGNPVQNSRGEGHLTRGLLHVASAGNGIREPRTRVGALQVRGLAVQDQRRLSLLLVEDREHHLVDRPSSNEVVQVDLAVSRLSCKKRNASIATLYNLKVYGQHLANKTNWLTFSKCRIQIWQICKTCQTF